MQKTKIDLDPYDPARVNAVMIKARQMRNAVVRDLLQALANGRLWEFFTGEWKAESNLPQGAAPQA